MANYQEFIEAQKNLAESLVKIKSKLMSERMTRASIEQIESAYHATVTKFGKNHEVLDRWETKSDDYFVNDYYGTTMSGIVEEIQKIFHELRSAGEFQSGRGGGADGLGLGSSSSIKEGTSGGAQKPLEQSSKGDGADGLDLGSSSSVSVKQSGGIQKSPGKRSASTIKFLFFMKIEEKLEVGDVDGRNTDEMSQQLTNHYDKLLASNEIDEEVFHEFERVMEMLDMRRKCILAENTKKEEKYEFRSNIKLRELKIPEFSGNIEDWESFHDLFKNLVHDSLHFSDVEKMYRLKAAVKGDAAQLIQHLKITDTNYEAAFELLKKRYENRRLVFTNLCDKILDQPMMNSDSATSTRQMLDTTKRSVQALRGINVPTKDAEPFIARIIVRKFDKNGLRLYEQQVNKPREIQTLEDVLGFLQQQYLALEAAGEQQLTTSRKFQINSTAKSCYFCEKSGHGIMECRKMISMSTAERKSVVMAKRVCFVCLLHKTDRRCTSSTRCKKCGGNHHELLHNEYQQQRTTNQPAREPKPSTSMVIENEQPQVLLATAQVKVRAATGEYVLLRAMIDQGSQITSISEEAYQILGLPRIKEKTEIHGLGGTLVAVSKYKVNLEIKPRFMSNNVFNSQAMVLPMIMSPQPSESFDLDMEEWQNYILADPLFNKSDRIDLIIGGDIYADIMEKGQRKTSGPFAQQTKLGWMVSGKFSVNSKHQKAHVVATNLERFWEIEEVDSEHQSTNDDQWCMQNFEQTTAIHDDGRITVQLPLMADNGLGDSKAQAVARFLAGEKKLERNEALKSEYDAFMREYVELGHMVQVPTAVKGRYYLPHQAVVREESLTTKVRVVFDASAKTSNGRSLNDIMYTGPKLQRDIFDIMLKWRLWPYVLTADVEKMYRQIRMRTEDQEYQYILWRESKAEPIKQYRLTTVTYGTSAAPFLAVRSLFLIADNCENPNVAEIIRQDFYMDDLMTGADSIEGSQFILRAVSAQLQKFNFHLRKWLSNEPAITQIIEDRGRNEVISIKDDESVKTLGVEWDPSIDEFSFKVSFNQSTEITKRKALSMVARIFDPLGWLSPITIVAKLVIQKLWLLNTDWDEALPEEVLPSWLQFTGEITSLTSIRVPRWVGTTTTSEFELHGFADASEKAYAAVVYIKCDSRVTLLTAKSKVNPIKNRKTLPKLELCAAHLLAKVLKKASSIINRESSVFAWSDSTITLGWIENNRNKDKFIRNKVQDIKALVPTAQWRHVSTRDNPADVASRGIQSSKLRDHSLWWNGPDWMHKSSAFWPQLAKNSAVLAAAMTTTREEANFLDKLMASNSSYVKLLRGVAYILRFVNILKGVSQTYNSLTASEVEAAEECVLQRHQLTMFKKEVSSLKRGSSIEQSSRIVGLYPFLDNKGILRVGGRLQNSNMSFNQKHPIILDKSHLASVIVRSFHLATLHGGNRLTEVSTRRKYWILGVKGAIKNCIRSCTRCIRYKQETAKQIMGNLPEARVTAMQPFLYTGVDYAGPMMMKCSRNRGQKCFKGYIAVFLCMSTKAIHLEAVSDLSTPAFLAALRRFFARRGKSARIYSDNGTNFVGAKNRLDADYKAAIRNNNDAMPVLAEEGVEWHFIPPAAPHHGGIWESGVKSVKHHLKRVIGETKLTYEEMATLLCQIEAVLNSRPLLYMDNEDIESLDVLSPGHFLVGRRLIDVPEHVDEVVGTLNKWKLIQKMRKDFWNRWKEEYLSTLQQRRRWIRPEPNMSTGDVVIVKDELTHPAKWPLGRVIETHPGKDGKVRVVSLKLQNGILKRPVQKLCPLMKATCEEHDDNPDDKVSIRSYMTKMATRNMASKSSVSMVMMLILLMTTNAVRTLSTQKHGAMVRELGNRTFMYMDKIGTMNRVKSSWKLVAYYNMEPYFTTIEHLEDTLQKCQHLCAKLNQFEKQCESVLNGMSSRLSDIYENDKLFYHHERRRNKRAPFEFVGSFYHILFGVMDADDRTNIEDNMKNLLENQHNLKYLTEKQTSVVESTLNILKKTTDEVNAQFRDIHEKVHNMSELLNTDYFVYKESINFFMMTRQLENLMGESEKVQAQVIGLLMDINHGKINPNLIRPSKLQAEIIKIRDLVPSQLRLPGKSKEAVLQSIYRLMVARGIFVNENLVIDITIPLLERQSSEILNVIPLPIVVNGKKMVAVLRQQFLVYNYQIDSYHLITQPLLNQCQENGEDEYLCKGNWAWDDANDNSCELASLKPSNQYDCSFVAVSSKDIWVELHKKGGWLFRTYDHATAHVLCSSKAQEIYELPAQGVLTLEPGCAARIGRTILSAPQDVQTELQAEFTPYLFKEIENISRIQPLKIDLIGHASEIEKLREEVRLLKKSSVHLNGLNFHHVSGHLSLSLVIILVAIGCMIYVYVRCRSKSKQAVVKIDLTPHQPSEIY